MKFDRLTLITGNQGKVASIQRLLHIPFDVIDIDLPEIQSLDLHEIVKHKATSAYEIVQKPVLVEDTSMVFDEWGRLPGPFIKWFEKEMGNKGLSLIAHTLKSQKATATVLFGLFDGVEIHLFEGVLKGTVTKEERGSRKFGWDPIFMPDGLKKTIAELTPEELDEISPRRTALVKLEEFLA